MQTVASIYWYTVVVSSGCCLHAPVSGAGQGNFW